jgi:kynurenine formamidase
VSKKYCILIMAMALSQPVGAFDEKKLVDLTHVFDSATIYWPTAKPFQLERVAYGRTPAGFWYASNNYAASEHGGTHMDAPIHFAEGKWSTDEVPLDRVVGMAVVIDVTQKALSNADYRLTVDDVLAWEKENGRIPEGSVLLLRTGWGRFWDNRKRYLGTDRPGDTEGLRFPGFSGDSARFLVLQRRIKAVGIDTASLDYGQSRDFIAHQLFNGANIAGFENIANLEKLPLKGAVVFGIPMKIGGGSGAPARVFALLP